MTEKDVSATFVIAKAKPVAISGEIASSLALLAMTAKGIFQQPAMKGYVKIK